MIKLYVLGLVGNLGTKVLIEEKQDELVNGFNREFITHIKEQIEESLAEGGVNPSLIMSCRGDEHHEPTFVGATHFESENFRIFDVEDIGKGGVLTALWKICDRNKWGLRYSLRKIPILQGTIEIANHFDLNPYRLLTKNSFIVAIEGKQNDSNDKFIMTGMGEQCEPQDYMGDLYESKLTYIGDITNERKRVRIDCEAEAFLTKDYKDEIDKVIPNYIKKMGLL